MGRIIDLDKVLELDCLSKKARKKIEELPAVTTISHRSDWVYKEDYRSESEKHDLAAALICAYRYAVERHGTQCLTRGNLSNIILSNLDLMCDDFIRQMIDGIFEQRRWHSIDRDHRYPILRMDYLLKDFADTMNWLLKEGKIEECKKFSEITRDVQDLSTRIQWLEKSLRQEIEKVYYEDDLSYLDDFLEKLQQEYERRGFSRIEEK